MWPIVPTLTWGLVRWKTSLAIVVPSKCCRGGPASRAVVRVACWVHAEQRAPRGWRERRAPGARRERSPPARGGRLFWGRIGRRSEGRWMELLLGIEPKTSSLPRKCSTAELQQRRGIPPGLGGERPDHGARARAPCAWSGRWESNPRVQLGRLTFYH